MFACDLSAEQSLWLFVVSAFYISHTLEISRVFPFGGKVDRERWTRLFDGETNSDLQTERIQGKLSCFPFHRLRQISWPQGGAYRTGVSHRLNETLFKHFAYFRESECLDLWHGRGPCQIFWTTIGQTVNGLLAI